jgi:predicted ferric reductase
MDPKRPGKLLLVISVVITLILYFLSKPANFNFAVNPWLYLSQILALTGAVLLSFNFILSTRANFVESLFGGLDKLYHFHHFIGTSAFVLIINHPLFLVLSNLPQVDLAKNYLLIGNDFSYNLGILAVYSFILILLFTFLIRLPYHRWLSTHKFLGLPLFLTLGHVFLITSDVSRYLPLRMWLLMFLFIAIWSYLYKLFFYETVGPKFDYLLTKINNLGNIVEFFLSPQSRQLKFTPGQYIFIKFIGRSTNKESHPFSISSSPSSTDIRLSIKRLGDYTGKIDRITTNTPVHIIGPYGQFSTQFYQNKPVVCLAGGIGITPFLSMLAHEQEHPLDRPIDLYYCVSNESEAVYLNELLSYQKTLPKFHCHPVYSQEHGYLTAAQVKSDLSAFDSSTFFLCGPKPFMDSFQQNLSRLGIRSDNIIFEDFSFYEFK